MAVIQYTGIINQIRGSIQGSVFTKTKTGFAVIKKQVPRKVKSISQSIISNGFAINAGNWNSLNPTEQTAWATLASLVQVYNRLGILTNISGFNFYMLSSGLVHPQGAAGALVTDGTDKAPYLIDLVTDTIEFQAVGGELKVIDISGDITLNTTVAEACTCIIYISQPSKSILPVFSSDWYRLGTIQITGGQAISTVIPFSFTEIPAPYGLRILDNQSYLLSAILVNNVSQNFSPRAMAPSLISSLLASIDVPVLSFTDNIFISNFESGVNFVLNLTASFPIISGSNDPTLTTFEWYYRGWSYDPEPFITDFNTFLAVAPPQNDPPGSNLSFFQTVGGVRNMIDALSALDFPKSGSDLANYLYLTIVPVFIATGLRGQALNFRIERLET